MSPEEIAHWEGFAVALGGAAAVLAGLVFVAISINVERILRIPGLPGRGGESVVMLLGALVACALLLIPGQSPTALGVEFIVAGASFLGVMTAIFLPALRTPGRQPRSWHVTRALVIAATTFPTILAGLSLLDLVPGTLYWIVVSVLGSLLAATVNAWILLVEVIRDEHYAPMDEAGAGPTVAASTEGRT